MASPALPRPLPRRKKTAPPPPPSTDNSSSDDDDNASEKEEEEKTPPPAQPSHENDADDDGSDDDDDDSEKEEEEKTLPPAQPSHENDADDDGSDDDDSASYSEKEEEGKTLPPAQPSDDNDADDDGSDDDDDDNASDSEKEGEKTPPPAQPSHENDADDDGSDDNDDNASDSEKEEEKTPPPAQPFHENDADDDGSDDDDDKAAAVSEDGEEVEEFEKHGTGSESGTSVPKPQAVTLTPLAVAGPSGEQESRLELVATAETFTPGLHTESKSKTKWTDAEQLMLLKEMVGYSRRNGDCKISNPYMTNFRTSIEGLPICKFSACQILEKMKSLKKKHDKPNGFGQGNEKMLKLSEKLWGEYGKGNGKKRKRADVKDKVDYDEADNAQDDDDAGYKKRKRADVKDKVDYDDADNAQDDDDAGYESDDGDRGDCARLALLWQDAMVGLAGKKLAWPESFTRHRIAAMDDTRRDAMARKWIKGKGDLDSAMVNFSRVEDDCLVALLSPY